MPRQGAVTRDGKGETVSGMVIMLKGQNSKTVIERVKQALDGIHRSLPEGVRIVPFYDQSVVIDGDHPHGALQPAPGRERWWWRSCSCFWATFARR